MIRQSYLAATALLLAVWGCKDDVLSPTDPITESPTVELSASTTAPLTFLQVSAGVRHGCGVASDKRAYCWGYNQFGQLGTGSFTGPEDCQGFAGSFPCSTRPVPVAGGHQFVRLSAGDSHTCGLTTDNKAYCWGGNGGRLGDGTTENRASPVAVAGGRQFRQVESGYFHSCGVTSDNRAFCWGSNSFGQLGDGTTTLRLTPVAVSGGHSFKHVSTSIGNEDFTCGITTASRAYCWGNNRSGQVGDSSTAIRRVRPVLVAGGRAYKQVDAGAAHACAVTTGGKAFCWGDGRNGALGNNRTYLSFWPRAVAGGLTFDRVTSGNSHTCGETTGNRAYCWGLNNSGQLGDGTATNRLTPVSVAGGHFFAQLSAGDLFSCGMTSEGKAYCWGHGLFGQLGNGTSGPGAEARTPSEVLGPA